MQKEKKDVVGDIFNNKLGQLSAKPDSHKWEDLQKDLNKKRFYFFGFRHFNIYYLSGLLAIIGLICFFGIKDGSNSTLDPIQSKSIKSIPDSSGSKTNSKKTEIKRKNTLSNNPSVSIKKSTQKDTSSIKINHSITTKQDLPKDTLKETNNLELKKEEVSEKLLAEPKVIKIKKRDTIIETEIIKVKKRKTK